MKRYLLTISLALTWSLLFAQGKMNHASMDLKADDGSIMNIIPVKNTGVLFDILNLKSLSHDLVFYDMTMQKKWTYSLKKEDLGIVDKISMALSHDELIFTDGKFIYVHVKAGMAKAKSYSVFCIDMDGKLEKKTEQPVEEGSLFKGILTDAGNVYMFFTNGKQNEKQLYYFMQMDPVTYAFSKKIILDVPVLKKGEWTYAGHADGKLFFYGFEDQKFKDEKTDGLAIDFVPVLDGGKALDMFTIHVKLDKYLPCSEYSVESGNMITNGPLADVTIDSASKAIYVYCHMAQLTVRNQIGKSKGVYLQKYNMEGNTVWAKQYDVEDLTKFNADVATKEPMSYMYRTSLAVDDSTKDILMVRKEVANMGASDCKCFYFDEDGNLKKAFMGLDQSSRMFKGYIESPISPLYTSISYKTGDPTYYKSLQSIFSKYPPTKSKPMAYMVNVGGKHWVAVMDGEKNTLDIYEL